MNRKQIRRKPDSELNLPGQSPPKLPAPFEQRAGVTKRENAADSHKGEQQNITSQSINKSDRQSDNDSNASGSGVVAMKKPTKNKEQRTSKPFRPSKRVFDEKDDSLKKWFHKMTDG